MERGQRPKIDVIGWFAWLMVIGVLWIVALVKPYKEYFSHNGVQLAWLVAAMLMTVISWLVYVMIQSRSWEDYGDEVRQWQADHDVQFAKELFQVTFGKAMEIYNIAAGQAGIEEGEEVIGG